MTKSLEDRLHDLGAEPVAPPRAEFVAQLESELRRRAGEPEVETTAPVVPIHRGRRVGWLAGAAAAALLLGVVLVDTGSADREVRTLTPAASSTVPADSDGGNGDPGDDKPAAEDRTPEGKPDQRPEKDDEVRHQSTAPPADESHARSEDGDPAPLRAAAFRHHTRVMIVWDEYGTDDFAYFEVRRADGQRPGYTVIARHRDREERGTADQLKHPEEQVRYQVVVVTRDGRVAAASEWLTPEDKHGEGSSSPSTVVPALP